MGLGLPLSGCGVSEKEKEVGNFSRLPSAGSAFPDPAFATPLYEISPSSVRHGGQNP
jgi:hypothetical protein